MCASDTVDSATELKQLLRASLERNGPADLFLVEDEAGSKSSSLAK